MPTPAPDQLDALFAQPLAHLSRFSFDEEVVRVFPDMINRSVPGYAQILAVAGLLAKRYVPEQGRVYDLGCSLGGITLSVAQQLTHLNQVALHALDNSPAMIQRCAQLLAEHLPERKVDIQCADIRTCDFLPCDLVVLNFTLQFLPHEDRQPLLDRIHTALKPGGVLLLSEKIHAADSRQAQLLYELHHDFKRANGYSDLEISQKRTALEDVMLTDTPEIHQQRLQQTGFSLVTPWFQYLNFASFLAIKGASL